MTKPVRLAWQLFPSYLVVILLSMIAVGVYAVPALDTLFLEQTEQDLSARADIIVSILKQRKDADLTAVADEFCKTAGKDGLTRVTMILPSGAVIGDSQEDPARMENHADRPEVQQALQTGLGRSMRYSPTLGKELMYLAMPIEAEQGASVLLRVSMPVKNIEDRFHKIFQQIVLAGLFAALLSAMVAWIISKRLVRPIEELIDGAERFADGKLEHRLPVPGTKELAVLAGTMNHMAQQLDERIQTIVTQQGELEAIMSSMNEAILLVDQNRKIIRLNRAGAELMQIDSALARQHTLLEILRNNELHLLIERAFQQSEPVEAEIVLEQNGAVVQAQGICIRTALKKEDEVLVVLHDISKLKRLENIRRDFVANVSHELKTPVTSIKGFVETLRDDSGHDPEAEKRFLDIIAKQADRLGAIIEDLLSLSRIEQAEEKESLELTASSIKDVVLSAVQNCASLADDKGMKIEIRCVDDREVMLNPPLMEQAIVNLLDNAVKYSAPGSPIEIEISRQGDEITVSVLDKGCGIPKVDLPHIFERFYRVDKSRSRNLGGTGLGLSIVKHIIQLHKGRVSVTSTLGEGSTFCIALPLLNR